MSTEDSEGQGPPPTQSEIDAYRIQLEQDSARKAFESTRSMGMLLVIVLCCALAVVFVSCVLQIVRR